MKDVKEITNKLEQGVMDVYTSDNYKNYLSFMGKFYNYSAGNCILIWVQKPDASLVAGYKTWQNKFKRQVRKGEKSIYIIAPCPRKYMKEVKDKDGNMVEKEVQYIAYKAVPVFDISQTDGDEVPTLVKVLDGEVVEYDELIGKLIDIAPVPVTFEEIHGSANGYFSPAESRIVVKNGMSQMQTVKTLVHEIGHAMLHAKDGEEKDASRDDKEIQAESIAFTVCSAMGIDTSEYSFGYIAGWSKGRKANQLQENMEVIRKTAAGIIDTLMAA